MKMHRDKIYDNDLLDYYGSLLTDRQNEVMRMYIEDDMSMQEIADSLAISKPGVQDLINRTYKTLDAYEDKLRLIELAKKRDTIYREIKTHSDDQYIIDKIAQLEILK